MGKKRLSISTSTKRLSHSKASKNEEVRGYVLCVKNDHAWKRCNFASHVDNSHRSATQMSSIEHVHEMINRIHSVMFDAICRGTLCVQTVSRVEFTRIGTLSLSPGSSRSKKSRSKTWEKQSVSASRCNCGFMNGKPARVCSPE